MNKYPKRPVDKYDDLECGQWSYYDDPVIGRRFRCGSASAHAQYLIEMSRQHPIMYWIWYRWWLPLLLHEDEYVYLSGYVKRFVREKYRPYWADFALYHPIQFVVFLFLRYAFHAIKKFMSFLIKIVGSRLVKLRTAAKEDVNEVLINDEFVEKKSDVPSDDVV
jgi:hypothetical protein